GTYAGVMSGTGSLTKQNTGTLVLTGTNSFTGGTTVSAGTLQGSATSLQGNIVNNAAVVFDQASNGTYAGNMSGTGSLTKQNTGTLVLTGANSYSGGTTVSAGTLQGNATSLQGNIVNNAAVVFDQASNGTYAGNMSGTGSLTKSGAGMLTLSGNNSYTGTTTVSAGTLAITGSFAGGLAIGTGATLGGSGTVGSVTINAGGTVAPGNSIGTLTVNGSFTQNAGSTYQVEVNAAGQSDRIVATGAATINGGTVQVLAQPGTYARNTTYTILTAAGGRTGTYSGVTSNFAFLTPSLSYDANNVYLLLLLTNGAFAAGAQTANQFAVGTALDRANASATGDFSTVLNALAGLNTQQGPAALTAISGQQYSGFGSANVAGGLMFMSVIGEQMRLARGGSGVGTRVALAEACHVACDGEDFGKWSLWGSALGATGNIAGNNNSATLTYSAGGASTGIDYRISPNLLVGFGASYASGSQWVSGLAGRGTSDSYSASLYGSFTQNAFYVDALAGYAHNDNQMQRWIVIPGLQPRNAVGRTAANQLLGQVEAGYSFGIYEPAAASVTPFARLQAMSISQSAFSETGASSLSLNVAQQTTSSVRTVIGAELAGRIEMGWREKLALQFRVGWAHEYADTSRPVTAAFAGAPTIGYTVYGAAPERNPATVGLAASTAIAEATSVYFRYDGEAGSGTDNHVVSAGLRMRW
ncbi:MAG: autotransporter domain-containing protein, partial [Gemmatimonadaceae bacterium]|nr:autotransporter domain-containing protein [Gemmatimonadaceae bacterium]